MGVPYLVIGSKIAIGDVVECYGGKLGHVVKLGYSVGEGYLVTIQPEGGNAFEVRPAWVLEHGTDRKPVVVEIMAGNLA